MKNTKELLGARIREIRKSRSLTQEKLAEIIDVEQKHVSRIEVGKNYPTIDRLEKIADALGVPMMTFFDFMHLNDAGERAKGIEEMIRELDEDSQKMAYKIFTGIIKSLKEV
ncbi:MAG: helix-turn-helix transcriptional regulator [Geobacter sp.]|nr:helix-turn-helix transcriptional regulator [Geobacter sp.]